MSQPRIHMEDFLYDLPDSLIARYPLPLRSNSKLLSYNHGSIEKHLFSELVDLVPVGSGLVFNTTRVIQARLQFRKSTGARIEVFCLEPVVPADPRLAFQTRGKTTFKCLLGNARKWKKGPLLLECTDEAGPIRIEARKAGMMEEGYLIEFRWEPMHLTFGELLELVGMTPIPPYLGREAELSDRTRYQTIYGTDPGSVAAPTAGLHFTSDMLDRLDERKIRRLELTLHVGAGTFVPVKVEDPRHHVMHAEKVVVTPDLLEQWLNDPDGLIAVGTTSTRSLESLYWLGLKLLSGYSPDPIDLVVGQWEYNGPGHSIPTGHSIEALLAYCQKHRLNQLIFPTHLMILPGYRFRTIKGLITNFHLPGSTLLLLIAAFIGDDWKKVYRYARDERFRFLSYGDSSLLIP